MLQPGERIDEWVVDGPLGAGGTASVYRCHNATAPRIQVALKVLDAGALTRPEARSRLAREGEVLHNLEHPGIVRVHGVRPDASPPYLVMALVEGDRLSTNIQLTGPREVDEALVLLEALTEAVAYLHARAIAHRDIKPANVLLRDGEQPVLVDFGLVLEAGASRLTADGLAMGTVSYVPPEWATPSGIDPVKWDVYSLGTVFWEVLVGRRAFPLPDHLQPTAAALQVMTAKRTHPPLDPGPDVPFFLRMLIREMTHPDPNARPTDAGEVLARLRAGDGGGVVDPVELFRTPMPTWQQEESAPTLDNLATSEVPMAPEAVQGTAPSRPEWLTSFAWGVVLGGVIVALLFAAAGGWWLGTQYGRETPVVVTPSPAPAPGPAPAPAPVPEAAPAPAVPALEADGQGVPEPAPAAAAPPEGGTGSVPAQVGGPAFAAWVAEHPAWSAESAVASGLADADYLSGWEGAAPAGAAVRVSWYAAQAYCTTRGGLLAVDEEPLRWELGSGAAAMDWRQADGAPAWRAWDDRFSVAQVDPASTTHATSFRCRGP